MHCNAVVTIATHVSLFAKGLSMEIRFISSLTPEDESVFAPALLCAVGALLDQMPIAYTLRIETASSQVFQHSHPGIDGGAVALTARIAANTSVRTD